MIIAEIDMLISQQIRRVCNEEVFESALLGHSVQAFPPEHRTSPRQLRAAGRSGCEPSLSVLSNVPVSQGVVPVPGQKLIGIFVFSES